MTTAQATAMRRETDTEIEQFGDDHDSQVRLLGAILDAMKSGDEEMAEILCRQLIIPAETLMATKKTRGAQWIRDQKLRTETAEAKYGTGWLDR